MIGLQICSYLRALELERYGCKMEQGKAARVHCCGELLVVVRKYIKFTPLIKVDENWSGLSYPNYESTGIVGMKEPSKICQIDKMNLLHMVLGFFILEYNQLAVAHLRTYRYP